MAWLPVILIVPYLVLLLKNYRNLLKIRTFIASSDPSAFISVVVACHNEQENLPSLLNCFATQTYPSHLFEVIIVNDNSTDATSEIASRFSGLSNILAMDSKGRGKKAALRTGILAAKGELIITTDGDCQMGEQWLTTISAYYEQNKPQMIICPVMLESGTGFPGRLQEFEFLSLQGITAGYTVAGNPIMCNGANLAFERDSYMDHSGNLHDEINSGDDVFLLHSLKKVNKSGIKWLESPEAIVRTRSETTLNSFLRQRSRWISKGRYYTDKDTIVTATATFTAVILQAVYLIGSIFNPVLIPVFALILALKSVPDYLILQNTARRYHKSELMRWFLPAQLIYPFYVILVVLISITKGREN
jgi:poly-beta-1,6-N-acetyl-D-glucosamine synthase